MPESRAESSKPTRTFWSGPAGWAEPLAAAFAAGLFAGKVPT